MLAKKGVGKLEVSSQQAEHFAVSFPNLKKESS